MAFKENIDIIEGLSEAGRLERVASLNKLITALEELRTYIEEPFDEKGNILDLILSRTQKLYSIKDTILKQSQDLALILTE